MGYYGDRADETLDESAGPGERLSRRDRARTGRPRARERSSSECGACWRGPEWCWRAMAEPSRRWRCRSAAARAPFSDPESSGCRGFTSPTRSRRSCSCSRIRRHRGRSISPPLNPSRRPGSRARSRRALHRPLFARAPSWTLRAALGEMAELVLASQRAVPRRLLELGFRFALPELTGALADLCRRAARGPPMSFWSVLGRRCVRARGVPRPRLAAERAPARRQHCRWDVGSRLRPGGRGRRPPGCGRRRPQDRRRRAGLGLGSAARDAHSRPQSRPGRGLSLSRDARAPGTALRLALGVHRLRPAGHPAVVDRAAAGSGDVSPGFTAAGILRPRRQRALPARLPLRGDRRRAAHPLQGESGEPRQGL